jgi:hypothetical protein
MKRLLVPLLTGICMATACSSGMPGAAPDLTMSASSLMFGQEVVGQPSSAQPVTLRNIGTGTLQITSIVVTGNFQATNDCGGSLAAGASCTINVTFTPSTSGSVDGQIMVTDNAVGSPHSVRLSGTGSVSGPRCTPKGMQCAAQFPPCCPGLSCVPASTRAFCE